MSSFHVDEGNSYNMDRSTRKHRTVLRLVGERSFLAEAAANPAEGRLLDHHGIVRSGVEAMLRVKTDSEGEAVEWIVIGFLLMHLLLLVGMVAGVFYGHFARGHRSKGGGDREEHTAHSTRYR
jgi:hypothetical protein